MHVDNMLTALPYNSQFAFLRSALPDYRPPTFTSKQLALTRDQPEVG